MNRADGLVVGQPFRVLLLFDRHGFYASVLAPTDPELVGRAADRLRRVPGAIAASTPYAGTWNGSVPDVSMPSETRAALSSLRQSPSDD